LLSSASRRAFKDEMRNAMQGRGRTTSGPKSFSLAPAPPLPLLFPSTVKRKKMRWDASRKGVTEFGWTGVLGVTIHSSLIMKALVKNIAAWGSLLVAITVMVLWVRSDCYYEVVVREGGNRMELWMNARGRLAYFVQQGVPLKDVSWEYEKGSFDAYLPEMPQSTWYERLGFGFTETYWNDGPQWPVHQIDVMVPDWAAIVLLFILPAWRISAWRRRVFAARGFEVAPARV
jgi:hypothetical protein